MTPREEAENLDWGTNWQESFVDYITRIENQIDFCLSVGKKPPVMVIMGIFRDVSLFTPDKLKDVRKILLKGLGREPVGNDFNDLVIYIENRINKKVERGTNELLKHLGI